MVGPDSTSKYVGALRETKAAAAAAAATVDYTTHSIKQAAAQEQNKQFTCASDSV